ncbi:hypothetical protein DESC_590057 [Desulfosarcina cetonica]|nr:hypothetical protein DESC_590057 [Desulfosarcina cetonica]
MGWKIRFDGVAPTAVAACLGVAIQSAFNDGRSILDALVKSRISDGFVRSPRSRLANPEE